MKVFLSWSGDVSLKVAQILREWLPNVLQTVQPYVSSEDIDKGARWSSDIAKELEESTFGIVCITPDNVNAPWLNFEAGALSKQVEKANVCPFLFKMKRSDIREGPILQFQSAVYEKEDIKRLVHSLNRACTENALEETRVDTIFDVWWPRLQEDLDNLGLEPAKNTRAPRALRDRRWSSWKNSLN